MKPPCPNCRKAVERSVCFLFFLFLPKQKLIKKYFVARLPLKAGPNAAIDGVVKGRESRDE